MTRNRRHSRYDGIEFKKPDDWFLQDMEEEEEEAKARTVVVHAARDKKLDFMKKMGVTNVNELELIFGRTNALNNIANRNEFYTLYDKEDVFIIFLHGITDAKYKTFVNDIPSEKDVEILNAILSGNPEIKEFYDVITEGEALYSFVHGVVLQFIEKIAVEMSKTTITKSTNKKVALRFVELESNYIYIKENINKTPETLPDYNNMLNDMNKLETFYTDKNKTEITEYINLIKSNINYLKYKDQLDTINREAPETLPQLLVLYNEISLIHVDLFTSSVSSQGTSGKGTGTRTGKSGKDDIIALYKTEIEKLLEDSSAKLTTAKNYATDNKLDETTEFLNLLTMKKADGRRRRSRRKSKKRSTKRRSDGKRRKSKSRRSKRSSKKRSTKRRSDGKRKSRRSKRRSKKRSNRRRY